MDYQNDIVAMLLEKEQGPLLDRAAMVLREARRAGMPIIVVRFRDSYPEINPRNKLFSSLKESSRLREGPPGAEVYAKVAPQPGDIVVTKRRSITAGSMCFEAMLL